MLTVRTGNRAQTALSLSPLYFPSLNPNLIPRLSKQRCLGGGETTALSGLLSWGE